MANYLRILLLVALFVSLEKYILFNKAVLRELVFVIRTKKPRRDQMNIMVDILSCIKEPKIFTHIMYATQLSYIQLKKHLEILTDQGLAIKEKSVENQQFFKLTERGIIFIDSFAKVGKSQEQFSEDFGVK